MSKNVESGRLGDPAIYLLGTLSEMSVRGLPVGTVKLSLGSITRPGETTHRGILAQSSGGINLNFSEARSAFAQSLRFECFARLGSDPDHTRSGSANLSSRRPQQEPRPSGTSLLRYQSPSENEKQPRAK